MGSDWNAWLERVLGSDLTVAEYRLALAIARLTLGWRKRENAIGERLLRERAGLDGRSFVRARDGLTAKGLVRYRPGRTGRGNRSTYTLVLQAEKPAQERAITAKEKPAAERAKASAEKARSGGTKKPAVERARIDKKGLKHPAASPPQQRVFDAYLAHGGNLELAEWRAALARQTKTLANRGVPEKTIVAAAARLGRQHAFPGYLVQTADEIQAHGGPCTWEGANRSALIPDQLAQCDCARCEEWAAYHREGAHV